MSRFLPLNPSVGGGDESSSGGDDAIGFQFSARLAKLISHEQMCTVQPQLR